MHKKHRNVRTSVEQIKAIFPHSKLYVTGINKQLPLQPCK